MARNTTGKSPGRGGPSGPGARGWWKLPLKITVTFALLTLIFWQVDWGELGRTLLTARLSLVGVVVALMMLSFTISAYKWQQLLAIHEVRYRLLDMHRWYFVAAFFNNFLPTSIGGDGYRVLKTLGNQRSRTVAVLAVTMERLSGMAILCAMAYVAAMFLWLTEGHAIAKWFVYAGTFGGLLFAGILGILGVTGWVDRLIAHPRCPSVARTVWESLGDFRKNWKRSAWALGGISVLFHLHTVFFYWLLLLAVGYRADPLALLVILAIKGIATVLPISVNGIGVLEGSFVYTATQFGIGFEIALSVILMVRCINLLQSGIGAVLYMRGDRRAAARGEAPPESLEAAARTSAPAGGTDLAPPLQP
jgi:glycosyltransferase 2 family protein